MASYNGGKYIREQIESLLAQSEVSVSILVRDDVSEDNTIEILEEYRKSGKLEWYTGIHLEVAYSFYSLMEKARDYKVDYFAFCDQDDIWDREKLKIATLKLNGSVDSGPALYYCGQRLVDERLNFIEDHRLNDRRSFPTRFILSDIAGCTAVFNRDLLEKILLYRPDYMMMHDTWILKVCLALGGDVIVDPEPHMDYRQHGENAIGLKHDFISQIRRAKQYIWEYQVEKQMHELKKGYGNLIVDEYETLICYVCGYKENRNFRKRLLDKTYINFYDKGLNFTYDLKIRLNKL